MASDLEAMYRKALEHFRTAYESLGEFNNSMNEIVKKTIREIDEPSEVFGPPPEDSELMEATGNVVNMLTMVGKVQALQPVLHDIHHQFGHVAFEQCWKNVGVGEEDKAGDPESQLDEIRQIIQGLQNGALSGNIMKIDLGNLDPDSPMKAKIDELMERLRERGEAN